MSVKKFEDFEEENNNNEEINEQSVAEPQKKITSKVPKDVREDLLKRFLSLIKGDDNATDIVNAWLDIKKGGNVDESVQSFKDFYSKLNEGAVEDWLANFDGVGDRWDQEGRRMVEEEWGAMNMATKKRIMQTVVGGIEIISNLENGHEEELKKLGKLAIERHFQENPSEFSEYIKQIKTELDIRKPQESDFEGGGDEEGDEESNIPGLEQQLDSILGDEDGNELDISEEELNNAIFKREVANALMQGVAFNSFSLIANVKEELDQINPNLFNVYMEYSKAYKVFYWLYSNGELNQFTDTIGDNFANDATGSTKVEWDNEDDEEQDDNNKEEQENSPSIKSIGMNMPILMHELMKGYYEVALSASIPSDPNVAKKVMDETDNIVKEIIQFKYGVTLLKDLLNYSYKNENTEAIIFQIGQGVFELFYFHKIMELPDKEFKEAILLILKGEESEAVDNILTQWSDDLIQSKIDKVSGFEPEETGETYPEDYDMDEPDMDDIYSELGISKPVEQESGEKDPSEMSQSELRAIIDELLDDGRYDEIPKYQQYLKESVLSFDQFLKLNEKKEDN